MSPSLEVVRPVFINHFISFITYPPLSIDIPRACAILLTKKKKC